MGTGPCAASPMVNLCPDDVEDGRLSHSSVPSLLSSHAAEQTSRSFKRMADIPPASDPPGQVH